MVQFFSTPIPHRLRPHALVAIWLSAVLTAPSAQAQPAASSARPDPLDPKASIPALSYRSSFDQYRKLGDDKPVSWREANDTVARIGGWRVYAREAQQPDAMPTAKPSGEAATTPKDAAKPMPQGHDGHKTR